MSVLLNGCAAISDACEWKGRWYYTKDTVSGLSYPFSYTRTGDTISSDLLEYVSFYSVPAIRSKRSSNRSRRSSKSRSSSSRRRVRHAPQGSLTLDSANSTAGVISGDHNGKVPTNDANIDMNTMDIEKGEDEEVCDDVDVDGEENDVEDEEGDDDGGEGEDDAPRAEESDHTSSNVEKLLLESNTVPPAVKVELSANDATSGRTGLQPVRITREHPLFGVWGGSFDVSEPNPGTEHSVPETFFLHSYLGWPVRPEYRSLPAPSYFTFSALRNAPFPLLPPLLMPQANKNNNSKSADATGGATEGEHDDDTAHDVRAHLLSAMETQPIPETTSNKDASAVQAQKDTTTDPAVQSASELQSPPTSVADPDAVTDGSGSSPLIIVVGFGQNAFGRFSLTASFNRENGAMVAEKRYMLTKTATAQRKGRRGTESTDAEGMTTRPRAHIDLGSLGGGGGRRKRPLVGSFFNRRGSEDFAYGDEEEFYGVGASSSHRRQRQPGSTSAAPETPVPETEIDPDDSLDYRGACYDDNTGEVYEGGWRGQKRHGRGIVLYPDGSMYEGQWVNGKEHGHGQLMTSDRKVLYSGDWTEGLMHGHGSYNFFSGDRYVGDWREGNRHGKGEFVTREGCKYVGDWRENRRSGRGVFTWLDGSVYDGDWDEDSRHGKGQLTLANGFTYEGLWSRNFFDGRGTTVFPDGQKYEGTYRTGLREGRGSITFPEGAVYEGRFRDDRLDGQGTIKVTRSVPGATLGERLVPIEIQADMRRIHLKAGFGDGGHH